MATAYTSLLGLALPVTGELSGTWGNTVNTEITALLDSAIAGTTTISADADITLTTTTGAANEAREAIILWTAGGTATRNITAPAQSKAYIVINASSSTQSIVLRGAGPTTGVTIIKGESAVCAWNGSDFVKIANRDGPGAFTTLSATGVATFSAGTAALPAITTTGDTNTGIFFPAADTIAFSEGGTEAMRIDSSGNVGIGTSSPTQKLDVFGAAQISFSGANTYLYFESTLNYAGRATDGNFWLNVAAGQNILFGVGAAEKMRIDSSGNVGIGNTAANVNDQVGAVRPLLVSKSDAATTIAGSQAAIVVGNSDTTTNNTSQLSFAAITGASATYFTSAAINCIFGARTNAQYPTGQLTFSTSTTLNAAPTEKMRISSSGNVGVGTSSPGAKLHVVGADSGGTIFAQHPGNSSFGTVIQVATTGGTDDPMISLENYNAGSPVRYGISCTDSGALAFMSGGYTGAFGTERMRIDSSGNVLVAQTSQTSTEKFGVTQSATGSSAARFYASSASYTNDIVQISCARSGATTEYNAFSVFDNNTTLQMLIRPNGNLLNSNNSYGSLSDVSLKENIVDATPKLDGLMQVKVRNYNLKDDVNKIKQIGVIAQELETVFPGMIETDGDGIKAVKYSVFVPMLVKAIQEQQALITSLTARITALEST